MTHHTSILPCNSSFSLYNIRIPSISHPGPSYTTRRYTPTLCPSNRSDSSRRVSRTLAQLLSASGDGTCCIPPLPSPYFLNITVCANFSLIYSYYACRICPGRFMADAELWITFATLLVTFNIRRALDENGNEIVPDGKYNSGFLS